MRAVGNEEDVRRQLGRDVQRAYQRKGLTLAELAEKLGYDEKTIRNIIAGKKVRYPTVSDVCEFLGIANPLDNPIASSLVAPKDLGGYSKDSTTDLAGVYVAYRRLFAHPNIIYRSTFEIFWESDSSALRFFEWRQDPRDPTKYEQFHNGLLATSPQTNLIYLQSIYSGMIRLITLTKFKLDECKLRGVISTSAEKEAGFLPGISPICLQKCPQEVAIKQMTHLIGKVMPGQSGYDAYCEDLLDIAAKAIAAGHAESSAA